SGPGERSCTRGSRCEARSSSLRLAVNGGAAEQPPRLLVTTEAGQGIPRLGAGRVRAQLALVGSPRANGVAQGLPRAAAAQVVTPERAGAAALGRELPQRRARIRRSEGHPAEALMSPRHVRVDGKRRL